MGVIVAENTFAENVRLSFKLQNASATEPAEVVPGPEGERVRFELEAFPVGSDRPLSSFSRPVCLAVDLGSLAPERAGGSWYLAYQDPDDPTAWRGVEARAHNERGLISACVDHFSLWSAGSDDGWRFTWQEPTVSAFSGAATYRYPIEVPPGRGGLQPNIDLSYSSRGLDSQTRSNLDQGPVGMGWSMSSFEIVREGINTTMGDDDHVYIIHPDLFSLVFDGVGYELSPAGDTSQDTLRYYVTNGPELYVERIYDANAADANPDRLYWIVRTPDGTTYRLGYTPDSVIYQWTLDHHYIVEQGHEGATAKDGPNAANPYYSMMRWQVDTVTDVYGNQIQYNYDQWTENASVNPTTKLGRIQEIGYNFRTRAGGPLTRVPEVQASTWITFDLQSSDHRVDEIELYHGDLSAPYARVDLNLSSVSRSTCGHPAMTTKTVDRITRTNGDGTQALPPTVLDYVTLPHAWGQCVKFDHLEKVNNGYGGRVRFTYGDHDGRMYPGWQDGGVPTYGQTYVVTKKETWDGMHAQPAVLEYSFATPCYNQYSGDLGDWPGAFNCPTRDNGPDYGHGALVGFQTTTETVKGYGGEVLSRQVYRFFQDRPRMGKPEVQKTYSPGGDLLTCAASTYSTVNYGTATFTYLSASAAGDHSGGEPVTRTVDYQYDTSLQGGAQYGQVTRVQEYDTDGVRRRIATYEYAVNAGDWVIAPSVEGSFDGSWNLLTARFNLYDQGTDITANSVVSGSLTGVRVLNVEPGACPKVQDTVDRAYAYDEWGRQTGETTYEGYGELECNASGAWTNQSALGGGSEARTTSTVYEDTYHLFPIEVCNDKGQCTETQYYGVNGSAAGDDGMFGQVEKVIDPNDAETAYRYEAFGRLVGVLAAPETSWTYTTTAFAYQEHPGLGLWTTVQRREEGGQAGTLDSTISYDGLGRAVQTVSEGDGGQSVAYRTYTARGGAFESFVPQYGASRLTVYEAEGSGIGHIVGSQSGDAWLSPASGSAAHLTYGPYLPPLVAGPGQVVRFRLSVASVSGDEEPIVDLDVHDHTANQVIATRTLYRSEFYQGGVSAFTEFELGFDTTGRAGHQLQYRVRWYGNEQVAHDWSEVIWRPDGPHTTVEVDALGRPVRAIAADGAASWTAYGSATTLQLDANRHVKLAQQDELGRLAAVQETLVSWEDDFEDGTLTGWGLYGSGSITEANGVARMVGDTLLHHPGTLGDRHGATFEFKHDPGTATSYLYLQSGDWGQPSYRRWGIAIENGAVYIDTYPSPKEYLMPLQGGVWYRALLIVDDDGLYAAHVWERDDPSVHAQRREDRSSAVASWSFVAQQVAGALELDHYAELSVHDTTYSYDAAGNLAGVEDAAGNETTITYDALGRKTGMTDPDMGTWSYAYHPSGALAQQVDAKMQATCLYYDELDRLERKLYDRGPVSAQYTCPDTESYDVKHCYDEAGHGAGVGRRTRVIDPSGETSWEYDLRGRVTKETKRIDGADPAFETLYAYNSMDQVTQMTYPSGEAVNTTYTNGLPETLQSAAYSTHYVSAASYNALGQVASTTYHGNLSDQYTYDAQTFRVNRLQVGSSLLDLEYSYDPVGNVAQILDRSNGSQQQHFVYDALDRLTRAWTTNGGSQPYDESYAYDPTGNITAKAGVSYTYAYTATHAHAVTGLSDGSAYDYDANGNMITRTEGAITYQQAWDVENRLAAVTNTTTSEVVRFLYDGDGSRVKRIAAGGDTFYVGDHYEVSGAPVNLVADPGFESGAGWTEYPVSGYPGTSVLRGSDGTATPHGGSHAYAIGNLARGWLESEGVSVQANAEYDLYAWVRGELDPDDSNGTWSVRVDFYDSGQAKIGQAIADWGAPGSLTPSWQLCGGRIATPSGTATVRVRLVDDQNSGWVAFDDVSLIAAGGGANLLADPGFESGTGWTEAPDADYPATSIWRGTWGTGAERSGSYGYVISNHVYGILKSSSISVQTNTNYDLYAWIRGEIDPDDSSGWWAIQARYFDASGVDIGKQNAASGGPGTLNSNWQLSGGQITTPANAATVQVWLFNYMNSGWVAYDDVSLIVDGGSTNLVTNPGFENSGGWTEAPNTPWPATAIRRSTLGTSAPHSGSYAYSISNLTSGNLTSALIPVHAAGTYQLQAYVRGELDAAGTYGRWLIRAWYYDANTAYLGYQDVDSAYGGYSSANWQQEGGQLTLPQGTAQVAIQLYNHESSGWVAFDDVSLVRTDQSSANETSYYFFGGRRVAMRGPDGVYYLHGDHLSSTSLVTDDDGDLYASRRYRPYGEPRPLSGTLPTDRTYTDQREESSLGIIDYQARYYSPYLNRWIQPDTIIPDPTNPQSLNRYSYVNNRPLNFTDPSGHMSNEHIMELFGVDEWDSVLAEFREGGRLEGRWGFLEMLTKLQEPGRLVNYPTEMARLYEGATNRASDYPLPGDDLLMTVSAGKIDGQWTLLEHLADGATRPISVLDAGKVGDVWIGGAGGKWSGPGRVDYGHGTLQDEPWHAYITLAPDTFDKLGAGMDVIGIAADVCGFGPLGWASDCASIQRSGPALGNSLARGDPPIEVASAAFDLVVDYAGFFLPFAPDILSLSSNFLTATRVDWGH